MRLAALIPMMMLAMACHSSPVGPGQPPTLRSSSNPNAPILTAVSPSTARAGSDGVSLTLTGSNFMQAGLLVSVVRWTPPKGPHTYLDATFVSGSELTVRVPASLLVTAGQAQVVVANVDAASDSYEIYPFSKAVPFTITAR
jgi:IPT/TIG domain-containing protein